MRNVALVVKHEIKTTLAKRSFWLTTFVLPLLIMAFTLAPQLMARDAVGDGGLGLIGAEPARSQVIGYVDQAGVVRRLPADISPGQVRAFADERTAQAALAADQIGRYYVIPPDVLATGNLTLIENQATPLGMITGASPLDYIITYNLVGDATLARLLLNPTPQVQQQAVQPSPTPDLDDPMQYSASFAVMFILFFTLTMSAGYMLQSVVKEKESRTAEVLLLSVRPLELMFGKVLGLGTVALLQMTIWMGGGFLLMNRGQEMLPGTANLSLPPGFLVWTLIYFLLGYLVYASALGALGALAPNMREGSQFTFILLLPLLIPLWFNSVFIQSPDSIVATLFSLFPLTAPTAMVTRMTVTTVPTWQLLAGVGGLVIAAYFFVTLAARFFRPDTLLSDASLDWRRLLREIRS